MRLVRSLLYSSLVVTLFAGPLCAQDFSQYRSFSFGMSVAAVEAQLAPQKLKTKQIHESPVLIQELTWWPRESSDPVLQEDSLWQVLFTFYDGHLYRILATYDRRATDGLTSEDIVSAISTRYGAPTHPKLEITFPTNELYRSTETVIARWEDRQNSFNLFRSTNLGMYGFVMFSKGADAKVRALLAESANRGPKEDHQVGIENQARTVREREAVRQKNKKAFRP
jgi:hypothetical protein